MSTILTPHLCFCLSFCLSLCLWGSQALAQSVGLAGMLGGKALVIIDGAPPKTVAPGETFKGVKVISTQGESALMEIGGKTYTLRVGDAPASVGSGGENGPSGRRVVLQAGSGGHFVASGQINGKSVQVVVDTGATVVALSQAEAQRIGLNYQAGQLAQISTANGVIQAWRMRLESVRIGDVVVYDVDSVVTSGSMPYILLGNSFLTRFQMTRTNDQMVLEKRF
jgi:aspartyl protease family protein